MGIRRTVKVVLASALCALAFTPASALAAAPHGSHVSLLAAAAKQKAPPESALRHVLSVTGQKHGGRVGVRTYLDDCVRTAAGDCTSALSSDAALRATLAGTQALGQNQGVRADFDLTNANTASGSGSGGSVDYRVVVTTLDGRTVLAKSGGGLDPQEARSVPLSVSSRVPQIRLVVEQVLSGGGTPLRVLDRVIDNPAFSPRSGAGDGLVPGAGLGVPDPPGGTDARTGGAPGAPGAGSVPGAPGAGDTPGGAAPGSPGSPGAGGPGAPGAGGPGSPGSGTPQDRAGAPGSPDSGSPQTRAGAPNSPGSGDSRTGAGAPGSPGSGDPQNRAGAPGSPDSGTPQDRAGAPGSPGSGDPQNRAGAPDSSGSGDPEDGAGGADPDGSGGPEDSDGSGDSGSGDTRAGSASGKSDADGGAVHAPNTGGGAAAAELVSHSTDQHAARAEAESGMVPTPVSVGLLVGGVLLTGWLVLRMRRTDG